MSTLKTIINNAEFMSDLEIDDILINTYTGHKVVVKSIDRHKELISIYHHNGLTTTSTIANLRSKYRKDKTRCVKQEPVVFSKRYGYTDDGREIKPLKGWKLIPENILVHGKYRECRYDGTWCSPRFNNAKMPAIVSCIRGHTRCFAVPE
jgi:hypothetical protein